MSLTITDVRNLLNSGQVQFNTNDVVASGQLETVSGGMIDYAIHHGWDPMKAHLCDKTWGVFNIRLMDYIHSKNYDQESLRQVLGSVQLSDSHWDWLKKSLYLKGSEYDWFFLMAEGYPQGACLIYHPKKSLIATGDIFYIEYLAAAPWNRHNPMAGRAIKGVATALMKYAVNFGTSELNLKFGFSLHALPSACGFYSSLGMIQEPSGDKPGLPYFEMPEQKACDFAVA